jgi:hypothetical protein
LKATLIEPSLQARREGGEVMTRSLRNRHRIVITALAFLVPIVFVSGLAIRKPITYPNRLPITNAYLAPGQASVLYEDENLWKGLAITTRVVAIDRNRSIWFLELQGPLNLAEPDELVYWSESQPLPDRLQGNAIFLGKLNGMQVERLALPERASAARGYLTIYSLAHMKIIATAELYLPISHTKGVSQ